MVDVNRKKGFLPPLRQIRKEKNEHEKVPEEERTVVQAT